MTQFYGKTKICYGPYALETLESFPASHAFVVTDPFMVKSGFANQAVSHLKRKGITFDIFSGVEPDPTLQAVVEATGLFLRSKADMILALGGGSAIDMAKAISYFGRKADQDRKTLLVAIPTTSGTGSEVTSIAVITDKVNAVKIPLNDELLIPDAAILDARFTRTVPPQVTASTGMDVLTHAVEAYTSRHSNVFTAIYAERAIRNVFSYLHRAYAQGDDMIARDNMLIGSCMAGLAFTNSGLGITHSMAHSLGGLFHIPHGLANAVLLPVVIDFNSFDAGVKYREIAEMVGLPAATVEEGTRNLVSAVRDLNASMGIPAHVRELKVNESEYRKSLDAMAANALEDICTESNPRMPSHDDIVKLLESVW
ncbi:MAG: 1-propanol dehydrogenase PduQ [Desulfovibrio sp.]|uniref:1-propanol dehydrogenase PduQ n=1 Tax=Desulfovibrio sp. TaxID=885 RepID=UPI002A359B9F|nr:1-propanol dehydrogenase PduQ [Desulfovibrio sp.]MDY0258954.1 1-propanol dehydrogenase PduQ [Desulfovibrio sp.]